MSMYICVYEMYVVINYHIICNLYHLQITIINNFLLFIVFVKKCGGMTIAIKVKFLRNISFFLYKFWVFVTEDNSNIKFYMFYNQFRHYTAANKFIDEKLMLNKEKNVAFSTTHIFTPRSYK